MHRHRTGEPEPFIPAADGVLTLILAEHIRHIPQADAVARLLFGAARELTVRQVQIFPDPVANRQQQFLLRFPHPEIDFRRVGLGGSVDGVVEQVGDDHHKVGLFERDRPQVGQVKVEHDPLAGGLLVFLAQQRIQQRVVRVHDGGMGRDDLCDRGKVRFGFLVFALLQQERQRLDVVGELVGQAALGGVGVHQRFGPLPLQRRLHMKLLLPGHLLIEHLNDVHVEEHRHRQAQRQQHHEGVGGFVLCRKHQDHVQHHDDAGEKGHDQRLRGFERPLILPLVREIGHHHAHDEVRECHGHKTSGPLPGHLKRRSGHPGDHIADRIFGEQAHGAVDEGGGQLLGQRPAEQQGGQQHIAHIVPDGLQREKADLEDQTERQHPGHQNNAPEPDMLHPPFAEVSAIHQQEGGPLRHADHVPDEEPGYLIHRQTAPSIPDRSPGWPHSRSG